MLIGKEKFIGKVPNKKEGTTYIHRWYTNDAKVEGKKEEKTLTRPQNTKGLPTNL